MLSRFIAGALALLVMVALVIATRATLVADSTTPPRPSGNSILNNLPTTNWLQQKAHGPLESKGSPNGTRKQNQHISQAAWTKQFC